MHRFVVASSGSFNRVIALCDSDGLFYVAHTAADAPALGTRLVGNGPKLGFGLLLGESLDAVYRVNFDAVRCRPDEALQSLQTELHAQPSN